MKLKLTPFLILALALILIGIFYLVAGLDGNLGPLFGILIIGAGIFLWLLYLLSKQVFKSKAGMQVKVESVLVGVVLLYLFIGSRKAVLYVPRNFQGYIYIVYGVNGKPPLQAVSFFDHDYKINLPASGIVFTSSKLSHNTVVIDSSQATIKKLKPGYDIPTAIDTLQCGSKKYVIDVFVFGKLSPSWDYQTDTQARNLKKQVACEMLQQ